MGRVRVGVVRGGLVWRGLAWGAAVAGLVVGAAVPAAAGAVGSAGGGAAAAGGAVPEADLAYHGFAVMSAGLVDLAFTPRNHGPAAVADATVRLRWSAPLIDRQELPEGCARSGRQVVLCRTGVLPADGAGERIGLRVRVLGAPSELVVELETVWGGGAVDRHRGNDRQRVLVLDTGDPYHF
ncbi:hypothetical protein ABZ322_16910 [Streptomyces sp. NPDC006129]|uniref:hypothetical protein n=1 Tax=Streptomyces sp. NPDC006129 TaxID=3155348 RepID=UPI0033AC58BC